MLPVMPNRQDIREWVGIVMDRKMFLLLLSTPTLLNTFFINRMKENFMGLFATAVKWTNSVP